MWMWRVIENCFKNFLIHYYYYFFSQSSISWFILTLYMYNSIYIGTNLTTDWLSFLDTQLGRWTNCTVSWWSAKWHKAKDYLLPHTTWYSPLIVTNSSVFDLLSYCWRHLLQQVQQCNLLQLPNFMSTFTDDCEH